MGAWIFMFGLDPHVLWSGALIQQILILIVHVIYTCHLYSVVVYTVYSVTRAFVLLKDLPLHQEYGRWVGWVL